jgi:hypothetical protein
MKHAQQTRRNMMNQPTNWGFVVDHTPGQMPRIVNVDAERHVRECLLASFGKLKQCAQIGGQARAEMFRVRKEEAEKTARATWSA